VPFVVGGLVLLIALTLPAARMELGFPSDADDPPSQTQRVAYDQISAGFGPGTNGPLLVVVTLPQPTPDNAPGEFTALTTLVDKLRTTPGVAGAYGPIPNSTGTAALISVVPTTGPANEATNALVAELRSTVIPNALASTSVSAADVSVGGYTAELIDLGDLISARLLWFIGAVVLAAFLLLMVVFRSVWVPLKAAAMNLLSIGAAYGVLVAVFQWGWFKDLIALEQTVPVAPFIPVLMFAILFGLSMDYEVFILSRIREEWTARRDATAAVVEGMAHTARVITAAALIMISVFLAFVTNPNPVIKMMGFGMAVAVLVDATIVRLMLVPSIMRLLGAHAWWLPKWLDRILPHISIDGPSGDAEDSSGAGDAKRATVPTS
jgi:RND superfamily putative drug exporter